MVILIGAVQQRSNATNFTGRFTMSTFQTFGPLLLVVSTVLHLTTVISIHCKANRVVVVSGRQRKAMACVYEV